MINNKVDEAVLADLKHLLLEAKQKLPPFLASLARSGCTPPHAWLQL